LLKIIFHFLRFFMPAEFIVVGVAFFSTTWPISTCERLYLFEPICTAILLAATSAIHVIRIYAIYDRNRTILALMAFLYGVQIIVTAVCCAFYQSVPLLDGQGCIAGPRYNWVGIYWLAPTLLYTVSFVLALARSFDSLQTRKLGYWKLMLRDGLSLYASTWLVNMMNILFWFIMKPDGPADSIKTIVTSMAAVLTVSMSLRIILSARWPLDYGGNFSLSVGTTASSRTTHVGGGRSANPPTNLSAQHPHTYTLDNLGKPEGEWSPSEADVKRNMRDDDTVVKTGYVNGTHTRSNGVKITIDKETGYDHIN